MAIWGPRIEEGIEAAVKRGRKYGEIDPEGRMAGAAGIAGEAGMQGDAAQWSSRRRQNELADLLERRARGEDLVSGEMLRQGLQQNLSGMRSMAASAAPQNAAMAARTAMMQGGRAASGLAGQQALAGLRESAAAQQNLGGLLSGMRGQDLRYTLGHRGLEMQGLQGLEDARARRYAADKQAQAPSSEELLLGAGLGVGQLVAMSDRRAKTDIAPGDEAARNLADGLEAYSYRYKDERHGKGAQLGIMAQDLEKRLPAAVVDTPQGKMVDGAKLATALAAVAGDLHRRVGKLEGGR